MNARSKEIANLFLNRAGQYSAPELFTDWVKLASLSFAKCGLYMQPPKVIAEREELYNAIVQKHSKEEMETFYRATAALIEAMDEEMNDYLGEIYMWIGQASSLAGQFFTPFHLSELTADVAIALGKDPEFIPTTFNEPACGSGGLIIAAAKRMKKLGINYQKKMDVVCQDLDSRCVAMCHVQLSLYGISAIVVQGSTLTDPYDPVRTDPANIYITPMKAGVFV